MKIIIGLTKDFKTSLVEFGNVFEVLCKNLPTAKQMHKVLLVQHSEKMQIFLSSGLRASRTPLLGVSVGRSVGRLVHKKMSKIIKKEVLREFKG